MTGTPKLDLMTETYSAEVRGYIDDRMSPADLVETIARVSDGWTRLACIEALSKWMAEEGESAVFSLRAKGATWQQIGDFYGITRQAAHERFRASAFLDKLQAHQGAAPKP